MKYLMTEWNMEPLDVIAFTMEQPSNIEIDMVPEARDVLNEKMCRIKYHALSTKKGWKTTNFKRSEIMYPE